MFNLSFGEISKLYDFLQSFVQKKKKHNILKSTLSRCNSKSKIHFNPFHRKSRILGENQKLKYDL